MAAGSFPENNRVIGEGRKKGLLSPLSLLSRRQPYRQGMKERALRRERLPLTERAGGMPVKAEGRGESRAHPARLHESRKAAKKDNANADKQAWTVVRGAGWLTITVLLFLYVDAADRRIQPPSSVKRYSRGDKAKK